MAYYYKSLNLHHMWKGGFHCVGGNFAAASRIVGFNNLSNFKRKVFLSRPSSAVLSNKVMLILCYLPFLIKLNLWVLKRLNLIVFFCYILIL